MGDVKKYYVGVDLGTSKSVLAYTDQDGYTAVQYIDNATVFPSVLTFTPRGIFAGQQALEIRNLDEKSQTVSNFKRMMGTDHRERILGNDYTVPELFAMILTKLIRSFEEGKQARIEKLVISVPADYGDAEREATFQVANLVGIKDVRLINESDAAAIAYCYDTQGFTGKITVYDMGGSTFDVTVLNIDENGFSVLANEGSKYLGGRDWDLHLASIIQRKILESTNMDPEDFDRNYDLRRRILEEAERQKIIMDRVEYSTGAIEVDGVDIPFTVTRNELDASTIGLVEKTISMTKSAFKIAGTPSYQMDRIVLVGAASITPLIRKTLEQAFPNIPVTRYDPMNAIARGASLYARSVFGDGDVKLTSVLNKTFGVKMGVDGQEMICNILYRNVPLPLKRTVQCRPKADDQKVLDIDIYENKAPPSVDHTPVTESRFVNKFQIPLEGKISRGKTKININFSAEFDGTMSLEVECNGVKTVCDLGKDIQIADDEFLQMAFKVRQVQ